MQFIFPFSDGSIHLINLQIKRKVQKKETLIEHLLWAQTSGQFQPITVSFWWMPVSSLFPIEWWVLIEVKSFIYRLWEWNQYIDTGLSFMEWVLCRKIYSVINQVNFSRPGFQGRGLIKTGFLCFSPYSFLYSGDCRTPHLFPDSHFMVILIRPLIDRPQMGGRIDKLPSLLLFF